MAAYRPTIKASTTAEMFGIADVLDTIEQIAAEHVDGLVDIPKAQDMYVSDLEAYLPHGWEIRDSVIYRYDDADELDDADEIRRHALEAVSYFDIVDYAI